MFRLIKTIFLGVIRIEPIIERDEENGLFILRDPDTKQIIGYPRIKESFQVFFKIDHLPAITQAMIRSRKSMRCSVIWSSGKVHEGPVIYHNEDNTLISTVTLKDIQA